MCKVNVTFKTRTDVDYILLLNDSKHLNVILYTLIMFQYKPVKGKSLVVGFYVWYISALSLLRYALV